MKKMFGVKHLIYIIIKLKIFLVALEVAEAVYKINTEI